MTVITGSVWAIDIGNNSLKALQLSDSSGVLEIVGFDFIKHSRILTGSGISDDERDEIIALSLREFVSKNNISKEDLIVSVPSQNSFSRFVNLPPVEKKRIPEIINFEASQQIPFDINEVQWDYQLMDDGKGSELKVGLFAIKNDVVNSSLEPFNREGLQVGYVQMASMALYNYLTFDRPELLTSDGEATVVLNMGAENTDLVICTKSNVWQRCIPMGGNSFTRAISSSFKLKFEKAEKLKRTAAMSKYARQILQAMKPVFTDLSSEIQRSIGFYGSSNPNVKIKRIIAFGGGTKMRGLVKYLQQSLQINIEMPDAFKNIQIGSEVSAAKLHDNICDFGVVYGLGLQALGYAKIENNLLPKSVARSMAWSSKSIFFNLAAIMFAAVAVLSFVRTTLDKVNYSKNDDVRTKISGIISTANRAKSSLNKEVSRESVSESIIQKALDQFQYRDIIPRVNEMIFMTLPNEKNTSDQKSVFLAYEKGDVENLLEVPRTERKQIFITGMSVFFSTEIEETEFIGIDFQKGRSSSSAGMGSEMDFMAAEAEMMKAMGFETAAPKYSKQSYNSGDGEEGEEFEGGSGFVISIAGYSPYGNIRELLDPVGADASDPSTWGIVTRMVHLDQIVDGNCPFSLFAKTDSKHFRLDTGEIGWDSEIPAGIGEVAYRFENANGEAKLDVENNEEVLIDPMTKEIISKVAKLDEKGGKVIDRLGNEVYQINDHWFTIDVKFLWKDAPELPEEEE